MRHSTVKPRRQLPGMRIAICKGRQTRGRSATLAAKAPRPRPAHRSPLRSRL